MNPEVESEGGARLPPPQEGRLHRHRDDSHQAPAGTRGEEPVHGEPLGAPVEGLAAEGEPEAPSLGALPLERERLGAVGDLVVTEHDARVSGRGFPR